jgi:general secretion pathway protein M
MKAWFQTLAPRERQVVVGGGGVLVLVLLYLLVVEPIVGAFAERQRRVETLTQQIEWMRGAAAEVADLRAGGADLSADGDTRPPYLAIDTALRGAGLPEPRRLEPVGDGGARLEFESVPFDPLVRIIGRLRSESGLRVTRARIQRLGESGRVSAQLTFERPAS